MPALDSSLGRQTPEGIEFVLFPAGIPIRACAWGIDSLIKGVVFMCLLLLVNILLNRVLGVWLYLVLNFVLDWFYYMSFELFWNGQSPGKRIMGIRVVMSDGSPVNPGASFLRNLLRFADGFLYLYLIAFISMAASPGFRRFGDWAGDTLVIYTAQSRLPGRFTPRSIPWLAGIPAIIPARPLSYEEKQGLLMFARRYPLLGRERADEIAHPWTAELRGHDPLDSTEVPDSAYLLGITRTISGVS
jgi:uncharacterized RDD family membrane protein YckC